MKKNVLFVVLIIGFIFSVFGQSINDLLNEDLKNKTISSNTSSSNRTSSNTSSSSSPSNSAVLNEIIEYAKGMDYAILKMNTKIFTRDSFNATWFDRHKASSNPNIDIKRTRANRSVISATLTNEYRFETTFYSSEYNQVLSLDISLQFVKSMVVRPENIPYLWENHYDRSREVDEPSGKYTLNESSTPGTAENGARIFTRLYENARVRRFSDK